jgi:hypothetical protein
VSKEFPSGTIALAVAFLALAMVAGGFPEEIAARFRPLADVPPDVSFKAATAVVRALSLPFALIGAVGFLSTFCSDRQRQLWPWSVAVATALAYISLQSVLWDWTIDDAAITFAYSENLVRGHGLVLHQGLPPEEAYSSTLWMLMLALARWVGFPIDGAAKVLGAAFATAATLIAMRMSTKILRDSSDAVLLLVCAIVVLGAPFVVWSSSGLEHGLQALLFVTIATLPMFAKNAIWSTALCLCALVLLRPESPLIVVATLGVYALDRFPSGLRATLRLWPLLILPIMASLSLLMFRLHYFGALFPNPYYAKAQTANFFRVINFVGGGWGYVFDWLSSSRTFLLVPVLLLGVPWRSELSVRLACALVLAQLVFVLYAGGDWMMEFRFIAPILPLLAVAVAAALDFLSTRFAARHITYVTAVIAVVLAFGTIAELRTSRATPTTPTAVVAAIGDEFVKLARRLNIEHPTLADHDAGGTSWAANIDVVDLGGLGDRAIAQHMSDPDFMRHYIFVERRPTFIFGSATHFAAGSSGFSRMTEFAEQYVPVTFLDLPYMKADLCHIRRDLVHEAPGISLVKIDGRVTAVIVADDKATQKN